MELVLATRNKGKLAELVRLLEGLDVKVSSLAEHPDVPDIVEDVATFHENARKKAREVSKFLGKWVLADDSGLVVDALGGAPGVNSARYSGDEHDHKANNKKLLREMRGVPAGKRAARFVCVTVLASPDGREWVTEGKCEGEIGRALKGGGGFGYDPLFIVNGEGGMTMAELAMSRKNELSHRGKALRRMRKILVEILRETGIH